MASVANPNSLVLTSSLVLEGGRFNAALQDCSSPRAFSSFTRKSSFYGFSLKIPFGSYPPKCGCLIFTVPKRFSTTVMEWQDCTVKMEIGVPASAAYKLYSDRESIPKWMPFISSVEVLKDKPNQSRWSLKYTALGRDLEYSWLAMNMQPIPNQKIHWRSLEGLPNRGAVRFFPRGPSSCQVELTVSYEVPQLLVPVASALKPLLESLLRSGLERFAALAVQTK